MAQKQPPPLKCLSVSVRCRPVLPHDRDQRICVQTVTDRDIECLDPQHLHAELRDINGRPDYLKENHCRERCYKFDSVFGPSASNEVLFERLVSPLVPHVLAGRHATCFAYGQTGSGKTHTMLGRQGEIGVVERTLIQLLGELPGDATTAVTFVEVYNEHIRDLLRPGSPCLELREDPLRGPCITGVCEIPSKTAEQVMQLVRVGNERRTEERTAANPVSSRSHAILQLVVETPVASAVKGKPKKSRMAKLSLIDLAGSERAGNTQNGGARLREGAMINRSLLALANCITALTRKGTYVNYRDSKLTRLLKDSLSGKCYTVMIAHVSPSITSFEETINTLKYAHRACEIRGMVGGVRENVGVAAVHYAERLQQCVDATRGLKATVAKMTIPKIHVSPPLQPSADCVPSRAVALVDALERSRHTVFGRMRERISIEQTALELDDQNEANAIEISKLELDAMCGTNVNAAVPARAAIASGGAQDVLQDAHDALCAATKRNVAQRRRVEQQAAQAERVAANGQGEDKFVALLAEAKAVVDNKEGRSSDLEKRLLHAEHANALLELEKIEAEQTNAVIQAASRKHELALRKQAMQLNVHMRALAAAEALLAKQGLSEEWLAAIGPLAKMLPGRRESSEVPSVDELLAELNAPVPAMQCAPDAAEVGGDRRDVGAPALSELQSIDEGFAEMKATLHQSIKLASVDVENDTDEEDGSESEYNMDEFNETKSDQENEAESKQDPLDGCAGGTDADGEKSAQAKDSKRRPFTAGGAHDADPREVGAPTHGKQRHDKSLENVMRPVSSRPSERLQRAGGG